MSFNFLNYGGKITSDNKCLHDSNIGYEANFTNNGSVDDWTYYDGIHTYGCWNSFLFGTLYNTYGVVGRGSIFTPIEAENFYTLRMVMKLNLTDRVGSQLTPTTGKIMWRSTSSTIWNDDKSHEFELDTGTDWHSYVIDLSEAQWWQGNINDLRIYPILENGKDGDEFFIRNIEILSTNSYKCTNTSCSYYINYEHNCPGIGERGYCKSYPLDAYVQGGTAFEFAETKVYDIVEDVNDVLLVSINGYGYERVVLDAISNCSGSTLAGIIAKEISKTDIGGYAECDVEYSDQGEFIIYSGTYNTDSTVVVGNNQLAVDLNFFDSSGQDISTKYVGVAPATGFLPYSSYKVKTHQLYSLVDSSSDSSFSFNPTIYNIEGGRRDWLDTGLGQPTRNVRGSESDDSGLMNRSLNILGNAGKTLIDFNHPFNASGRIKKIFAAVTLDIGEYVERGTNDSTRKLNQLSDAKIMFFRPTREGNLIVLPYEIDITNRDHDSGKLYSALQEYVELDCDIFINKGDYMGVYNANVYVGRSITGEEIDAIYHQLDGKASGTIEIGQPYGQGSAGIMLYARSDQYQNRLVLNVDLGERVNVSTMDIIGTPSESDLDFNVARCLDINWEVDLFGGDHTTGYITSTRPMAKLFFNHPNLYYGDNCLDDGIRVVPDGLAAESFSVNTATNYTSYTAALHEKDGGNSVVPVGAKYFHCNGDSEWLGVYMHTGQAYFAEPDFEDDPIAFTLLFPQESEKVIYKSKIYFKEQYNFRSFGLSTYGGQYYSGGDADDPSFNYIPNRDGYETPWVRINLDGLDYTPDDEFGWGDIDEYLSENPCIGHVITEIDSVLEQTYDETLDYYSDDGGLQYTAAGRIVNYDQYMQSVATDWSTLEHEWEPIRAKGFRFYCNNHKSTKICEFELYCQVENVQPSMTSSLDISYSNYGEYWWSVVGVEETTGATAFIGDTPRYIDVVVKPINEIELSELKIDVSYEDVYMGDKGCQHISLPAETKLDAEYNEPQIVNFKNTYGQPYDLYVDIAKDDIKDEGTVFFSLMSDTDSINHPLIGPDAHYKKHPEHILRNYQSNVAINCPVYALKNLMQGAQAWYTYDKDYSWQSYGQLTGGQDVDFSNLPDATITTINLPVLTRSKWWKIGFYDQRIVTSIREMQVYYQDEEIDNIVFYHHQNQQDVNYTSNTNTAPHLHNNIIDGSYYVLEEGSYIGFKLPTVQEIDKIVFYHDSLLDYENSHDIAGIDSSTALCIHGDGDTYQTDSIIDVSYYEHEVTVNASGIYCDEGYKDDIAYDFTQDFTDCDPVVETFDGPSIDTDMWESLVNASIVSGELNITNSGIIGEVTTVDSYNNDFDANVELDVVGAYSHRGWGGYFQAKTSTGEIVRVGRKYHYEAPYHRLFSEEYGGAGWADIDNIETSDDTGLEFRITRAGNTTTCYAKDSGGVWEDLGSSTVLGTDPVQLMLVSDLTPLASGITIAKFDNFSVDKSDSDWGANTSYDSSFTCVSGIGPNGWAYQYDTICANHADSGGYKIPAVYDTNYYPFDEEFVFVFDFAFQTDEFLTSPTGSTTDICGVAVGVLGEHVVDASSGYIWAKYFTGVQVVLTRDRIGIAVRNDYAEYEDDFETLDTSAMTYFCRLTGDGAGHYHCYVWTDTWNGSTKVIDFGVDTTIRWTAGKVGVGSGYGGYSTGSNYRGTGWVSDFDFSCTKTTTHYVLDRSSIRFSGNTDDRLIVDYDNNPQCNIAKQGFDFLDKKFTIDFWLKFNSLPENNGDIIYLIKSWDDAIKPVSGGGATSTCSWAVVVEKENDTYYWRVYINIGGSCTRTVDEEYYPDLYRWHHYYFAAGNDFSGPYVHTLIRDGHTLWYGSGSSWDNGINTSNTDVVVGQNLDGWMEEIRVSADYTDGGSRIGQAVSTYRFLAKDIPVRQYERYYTFSLYNSVDNFFYGKNMDVDVIFDNSYSHHELYSTWSEQYYTYFAIDFGQRHDVDIVRSYPIDTAYAFTNTDNVLYSNKDVADPYEAFSLTEEEQNVSTDFNGQDYDYPGNWTKDDSVNAESYIINDFFYQACTPGASQEYSKAQSKFFFYGNFDVQIDYDLGNALVNSNSWEIGLQFTDINNSDNSFKFSRCYQDGSHQYTAWQKDDSSTWTAVFTYYRHPLHGTLRLVRDDTIFKVYVKAVEDPFENFELLGSYQMLNGFNLETKIDIYTISNSTVYPDVSVWWDNFTLNHGEPSYSNQQDARWMRIKMLNGDGTTRTIQNLDIFPDITTQVNTLGQYNTYWESLGTAITSYSNAENIALNATVSGSSEVGNMEVENAVNGLIYDGEINECWGSTDEDNPWIEVHFGQVESIFRIKLYHGYSTTDSFNIITDYKIQTSTDGETFTTIFTITDNDEYERIHDLATPINAKVVRLYVDGYEALKRFIWTGPTNGYQYWSGAVLRQIEVYKYYDFEIINSEDTPIIAIDLQQSYFIDGHELIGVDAEYTSEDWDNSSSNFAWSSSRLSDPQKVTFGAWGEDPYYAKWVLVKRNTATHYPVEPQPSTPHTDTEDYLKHVVIKGFANEDGVAANPIEYPWMWRSSVSELDYNYDVIGDGNLGSRSLNISYPAGTDSEHVRFIEGDHFGWDEACSYRDAFGINLYIDNIDNLDLSYGYFYLGGYDYTQAENAVTFRWNMTTLSGLLDTGWNIITLCFMYADDLSYTEITDKTKRDPRRLYTIKWGSAGMVFRGKGNAVNLNLEGMYIARNYFSHSAYPGQYGLYLHGQEYLKTNIGDVDFNSLTIEFWIRPDWNWDGRDSFGDFKFRSLFCFSNVNNDLFGAAVTTRGLEIYYGNLLQDFNMLVVSNMGFDPTDKLTHMAFVCSNTGKKIGSDGSTVRVYINNALAGKGATTWEVSDNKFFNFVLGGQGALTQKNYVYDATSSAVDGVVSRLKIHNFCKTDFTESIQDSAANYQRTLTKPSNFIEISKDNVTYHKVDSSELPFFFNDVASEDSVPIWVRVTVPKGLTGSEKRTAKLLGSWEIGV